MDVYGFVDFEVELLGADLLWFFCGDDYRPLNGAAEFEAVAGAVFELEALALMDFVDGADSFFWNLIVYGEGQNFVFEGHAGELAAIYWRFDDGFVDGVD